MGIGTGTGIPKAGAVGEGNMIGVRSTRRPGPLRRVGVLEWPFCVEI
jgi:hypothetical protein